MSCGAVWGEVKANPWQPMLQHAESAMEEWLGIPPPSSAETSDAMPRDPVSARSPWQSSMGAEAEATLSCELIAACPPPAINGPQTSMKMKTADGTKAMAFPLMSLF
jgi:hypothetical protein